MRNLLFILMLLCNVSFAQIEVTHFNAGWNNANDVSWFMNLEDCKTKGYTDIAKSGEEVARFQADLSFKMVATKEEVQEEIDNQLMSDF